MHRPWKSLLAAFAVGLVPTLLPAAPELEVTRLTEELPAAVGGVAVDRLGRVYVADFGERVYEISPYGEVEVLAASLYGASGNAVDGEGRLFQASFFGNFVDRIDRDGTITRVASGLQGPVGIAVEPDGHLIVCNCRGNALARVAPDGTVSELAASELFNCPNGITRHPDGDLYVANFSDGRLLKVTPEGEVSTHAVVPGGGNGHVVWAAGALYVTGFRANRIYRVGLDGAVAAVAGTGRFGAEDGPGPAATFATPNGIAYDAARDVLYVNDYLVPFPQRNEVPPRSVVRKLAFPSLTGRIRAALEGPGGIDAAAAAYREYKRTRPRPFTEIELNRLGYELLQAGRVDAAIRLFELNAESYPRSFNVWDSLAEAHAAAGHRERAIELYERSLELNPANTNAVERLEGLRGD